MRAVLFNLENGEESKRVFSFTNLNPDLSDFKTWYLMSLVTS